MIDAATFAVGLGVIAVQVRHPLTAVEIDAMHAALDGETTPGEWSAFARAAVVRFGWRFLPGAVELVDALREFRGQAPLSVEAVRAYEAACGCGEPSAQGGTVWSYRAVLQRCGRAAAEAFLAAGGPSAFATTWNEGKTRERFVEAYVRAAREAPAERLLSPAAPTGALQIAAPDEPSPDEARELVERIAARAPGRRPAPAEYSPMSEAEWERRVALLREQWAAIEGGSGEHGEATGHPTDRP